MVSMGLLLLQEGRPREAEATLRQALQERPNDGFTLGSLAAAILEEGRTGEALRLAQRAAVMAQRRGCRADFGTRFGASRQHGPGDLGVSTSSAPGS